MGRGKVKRRRSRRLLRAHETGVSDRHNKSVAYHEKRKRLAIERTPVRT